ncbi:MAG: FAD-binding oxidoreductase [Actinomycetota bacterium]
MGIDAAALKAFTKTFKGTTSSPGDADYDESRGIFNTMIDRKPAFIARATDADDVAGVIALARDTGTPLTVRSGGHSVAGMSITDDAILLDTRAINTITVDPDKRVARVGGGAIWGELDAATAQHGLVTTGGRVSTTGVAGLTLGGGSGWAERKYGLACDRLVSVELVTADGSQVRASADENPDLFWALHGGGGNFGVATQFEFRLDALSMMYVGLILYTPDKAEEVARNYRDFAATAPDELGGGFAFLTGPPEEFVPEHLQGTIMCGVIATWFGDPDEGEKALAPITEFGSPDVAVKMPIPYVEFNKMLDDPPGHRNYWTASYHDAFPDSAIDGFIGYGRQMKPSAAQLVFLPWGGAVARVDPGSTPMARRDTAWVTHPFALWMDAGDDDFWINWARGFNKDMKSFSSGGVYLNFIGNEGEDRIVAAYGKANHDRLAKIKGQYDPDNVFRFNQNIKPA